MLYAAARLWIKVYSIVLWLFSPRLRFVIRYKLFMVGQKGR